MQNAITVLNKYWGYQAFRPPQQAIIEAVLAGDDVLALMPTGGGKSLCFQVPTMVQNGLCLVISPLVALMQDQVQQLQKRGMAAQSLHAGLTYNEVLQILQAANAGEIRFLYVSPERLQTHLFKEFLPELPITLIAVDEAHCISQWGYDFRPPYLQIAEVRNQLTKSIPIIAVTASATQKVVDDIQQKLQLKAAKVFRQSFHRANISYSAFKTFDKLAKAVHILQQVAGSAIVYCNSRKLTQEVAQLLQIQHIQAAHYHAGLSQQERAEKLNSWLSGALRVMVCTNAFGMGIDKPDVRTVIHYNMPDCIENYYQEAGRAGRDGKKAYAVLLYNDTDIYQLMQLPDVRFPAPAVIKHIYQQLANFLKIPVGVGAGQYYDFDMQLFATNFNQYTPMVVNTLKVLEQDGHLTFNETTLQPPKVRFTTTRSVLNSLEKMYPTLAETAKTLLRAYQGILHNEMAISEPILSKHLRCSVVTLRERLNSLKTHGIIDYQPMSDKPQLYFLLNRAPAQDLHIDLIFLEQRRNLYRQQITDIIQLAALKDACRSKYMATYFADTTAQDCGVCDNCLARKKAANKTNHLPVSIENYLTIHQPVPIPILLQHFGQHHEALAIWACLRFLQDEGRILIHENGMVERASTK